MRNLMKTFLTLLLLYLLPAAGFSAEPEATKDKITRDEAQHIALKQVPDGSVKSARLEREKGKKFWSVEIAKAGSKALTEVRVDALSGQILTAREPMPPAEGSEKPKR